MKKYLLFGLYFCLCFQFVLGQEIKNSGTVRGELGKKLDALLTENVDKGFSGVVLVARRGKIVLSKGYGLIDREKQLPVTIASVFPIGSESKQFTAAAIVKLEMQGKLKFTDPITKYLKDVPADKANITIHQLLTHSSGIPHSVGRCTQEMTRDGFIKMTLNAPLDFEPGKKYSYSNGGYDLLAAIVEAASGEEFEKYMSENLFAPAGMKQTGIFLPKYQLENIAVGYRNGTGKRFGNIYEKIYDYDYPVIKDYGYPFCSRGSGGMLSTIGDLYKWHQSFAGEKVFSKAAKEKIFTPYIREGEGAKSFYGYGWAIFTTPRKTKLLAHNGSINDVFEADFARYVDEDVVVIMMTNSLNLQEGAVRFSSQVAYVIFDK